MTKNIRLWAALVVTVLALGACGGGNTASTSEEATAGADTEATEEAAALTQDEWIDLALAECLQVNEAADAVEPEGDPFGPEATDEDREKGVAYLRSFADGMGSMASELSEAGAPAEGAAEAEAFVSALEESAGAFDEAASAAEEDFASAQPAVGEAFNSFGALESAAADAGIGDLEDCKREGKPAEEVAEGANEVPVTPVGEGDTYDFEFEQPVPAGKTAFVMENTDDEPHFMFIVSLENKGDLAKALEMEQQGDSEGAQKLAKDVAESDTAPPGETAIANADLEAGSYGMLCFISGPDGVPHAFNGMAVEFEVE